MQTPPQEPTPTQPAQTPQPTVTVPVGPRGQTQTLTIPRTRVEVEELLAQREELSDQLISVSARRRELAAEVRNSNDPKTRAGVEDRLAVLDQRILQLETDLATTGRQIASAPAGLMATAQHQMRGGGGDDFEEGLMIGGFSVLLLFPIALFFARRRWRRRFAGHPAELGTDSGRRLAGLEQGMEAIAIEIERISEGQRFVTRLLSESQPPLGSHRIAKPAPTEQNRES